MAPSKTQSKTFVSLSRRAISTRAMQKSNVLIDGSQNVVPIGKRKADGSPVRNGKEVKRSALGNVTNAVLNAIDDSKRTGALRSKNDLTTHVPKKALTQNVGSENQQIFAAPNQLPRATKVVTRATARAVEQAKTTNLLATATAGVKKVSISTTVVKAKKKTETQAPINHGKVIKTTGINDENKPDALSKSNGRRISNEFESLDDESHYISALEDL